ncbi:hypothetical protein PoB_002586900 [Plakobranchus ocellatus]|uniref:Uncharacterized protein n=1 Tax=Plakobranchus ocellatus TaxID=259542 RepID=A0AAV3ZY96_9GAST|nr:hypothetical protein PoB_002586900 [Plakobranchus ocellatus]
MVGWKTSVATGTDADPGVLEIIAERSQTSTPSAHPAAMAAPRAVVSVIDGRTEETTLPPPVLYDHPYFVSSCHTAHLHLGDVRLFGSQQAGMN